MTLFADLPNVLVVRRDSPLRSVADLLAAARAKPGELTYASSGSGSSLHLSGEMLKADAGVDILHVPFRGGADTANQIMGGRIDLGMNNLPSVITLIRGGQLRALAVTSPERSEALPEVPTVAGAARHACPDHRPAQPGGERDLHRAADARAPRQRRRADPRWLPGGLRPLHRRGK